MAEVVSLIKVRARAEGFNEVVSGVERIRAGYMSFGSSVDQAAPKVVNLTNALIRFERSLDPAGAKMTDWALKTARAVDYGFKTGLLSAEQAEQRMGVITQRIQALGSLADRAAREAQSRMDAVRQGSQAERIRKDTALVETAMRERNTRVAQLAKEADDAQTRQFYREYRSELSDRYRGGQTRSASAIRAERLERDLAPVREGSAAERARRDFELVERVRLEQDAKRRAAEQAEDARQEARFNLLERREQRLAQIERRGGGGAAEARVARQEVVQRRGEAELGGYLSERLQQADPLSAAYKRHEEAVERINRARRLGLRTEQELASILAYEQKVLSDVERDFGSGKSGFRANQRTNLAYQGYDILSGVTSGQPLGLIAAQQGPQIAQILGDQPGGIMGGIRGLASGAAAAITPFNLAIAATATAAIAGGIALYKFNESISSVEQNLRGAGRASGVSAGGIDAAARQAGSFNTVGQSGAREIFAAIAASGYADRGIFGAGTIDAAARYGRSTGQDSTGVATDFAQIFGQDTSRAIEMVQQKLGGVTAAQKLYIETLAQSGERGRAQAEILRLIAQNSVSATDGMNGLQKALLGIQGAWDFFLNNVGRGFDRVFDTGPLEQQLAKAEEYLKSASTRKMLVGFDIGGDISSSQAQVAELRKKLAEAEQRRNEALEARRGQEVSDLTRSLLPELDRQLALERQIADLRKGGGTGKSVTSVQEVEALARAQGANNSRLDLSERARKTEEIALRSVTDRTLAERVVTAEKQKELDLAGQLISIEERRRQIAAARALEEARARREAQDALRDARDASRSVGMLPFQKALTDQAAEFRKELERNPELASSQGLRRSNLVREMVGGPLQGARTQLNEQIAGLRVQADSFYASAERAGELAAKQDLLNQYARAGIPVNAELMAGIDRLAGLYGKAAGEADKFARTSQNITQGMDEIRSSGRGLLTGIFSDFRQGKNPLDGILNSLGRLQDQMFDRLVSKPLVESLVGFDGKAGGGLFGTGLSSIFGTVDKTGISALQGMTGQAVGTMTVNAATVLVNSGLGGASGLAGGVGGVVNNLPGAGSGDGGAPLSIASIPLPPARPSELGSGVDLPSWIGGRGTSWFSPALGASNSNAYLPGGSLSGAGEGVSRLVGPMQQQAEAMRTTSDSVAQLGSASSTAASTVGDLTSSIGRALGSVGSGAFSLFGTTGAQAATPGLGIPSNADGGLFRGRGGPRSDSNLSWISDGEYIVNAASTARHRPLLDAINYGAPGYADGGYVRPVSLPPMPMLSPVMMPAANANAPVVNHTINNYGRSEVETKESRGPNGEINMETIIRDVESRQATRIGKGRGPLRHAVSGQASGGAAFRTG